MESSSNSESGKNPYDQIPITECGEKLVNVNAISKRVRVFPYYFQQRIPGALENCFLREGTVERLVLACEYLPDYTHFIVLDGWRSYTTQLALYQMTKKSLLKKDLSPSEKEKELGKYVAFPSKETGRPSPHLTGGAIDLTLGDESGWLNMGTSFDEFHEKAESNWYENLREPTEDEVRIRHNRRLLKNAMEKAGFVSNPHEWWHFDYGNQRWAFVTKKAPMYSYIELPKEME